MQTCVFGLYGLCVCVCYVLAEFTDYETYYYKNKRNTSRDKKIIIKQERTKPRGDCFTITIINIIHVLSRRSYEILGTDEEIHGESLR